MIEFIKQIFCKHDWGFETKVDHYMDGDYWYASNIYVCKKCLKKKKVNLK